MRSENNSTPQTGHTISGGNGHTVAEKCEHTVELCEHPATRNVRHPVGDKSDHPVDQEGVLETETLANPLQDQPQLRHTVADESDHTVAEFSDHPVRECPPVVADTNTSQEKKTSQEITKPKFKYQARTKTIPDTSWLQSAPNETSKFSFLKGAMKKMQNENLVTNVEVKRTTDRNPQKRTAILQSEKSNQSLIFIESDKKKKKIYVEC